MHIPDGLMDPTVIMLGWVVAAAAVAISVRKLKGKLTDRDVPLMGILGAGIFVAQMLNFPIGGGTTGHLVGAALLAVVVGPYAAILIITSVLIIQCFMFGDGGLLAMGLNITNMGVTGAIVGWWTYSIIPKKAGRMSRVFIGSWLAVFLGAALCAAELAASFAISGGVYGIPGYIAFPAMLLYHSLIGVGEGIIAVGTVSFLSHSAPEVLDTRKAIMGVSTDA